MAEFHGIFCHLFLPSVLIIEGVGGMSGSTGWGEVGGGKNHHPISSHDAHTVANDTIVGHIVSGSKPRSPLPNWCPPWVPLFKP